MYNGLSYGQMRKIVLSKYEAVSVHFFFLFLHISKYKLCFGGVFSKLIKNCYMIGMNYPNIFYSLKCENIIFQRLFLY